MEGAKKLTWFILARISVVTVILISTFILNASEPWSINEWVFPNLLRLIISTYLFSLVSLLVLRLTDRGIVTLTYFQIIWDLFFVTVLLLLTGGIASPFSFLYLLSIINSSILLSRKEAYYTASLCGIFYGGIVDLQYYGVLAPLGLSQWQALQFGARYIFYTIFLNILAYYLTAFLTGTLAEKARKTETALKDKEIDFEELALLNSAIVASLTSGLLTINNDERIRVFNHAAQQLTGLKLQEVYDRPILDVLPQLGPALKEVGAAMRGELEAIFAGERKTLGFNSSFLRDKSGERIGTIINFQDLSPYKRLEADLKRADRAAAVGDLSAAIAHEIRNPLASISGSVQLISQSPHIDSADRRLIDIVLRETDRLNVLIRDFLAYARPQVPVKLNLPLGTLVSELRTLVASDPRFEKVDISPPDEDIVISVDPDQIRQVLWNLLVNAAQASPDGGTITISAARELSATGGENAVISIADTGSGMDDKVVKKIFSPFFTTKKNGTGLGLATVYRIVEAHEGRIEVTSRAGKGTTFTIHLPVDKATGKA